MPEINNIQEITNPKLVEAIELMKTNDIPLTRTEMLTQLISAKLLAPATINDSEQTENADGSKTTRVNFKVLNNKENKKFLMAFTDASELNKWKQAQNIDDKTQVVIMNFNDYANIIANSNSFFAGFVINPFGVNMIFPTESINILTEQKKAIEASFAAGNQNKGTKVILGNPKEFPQELADAIAEHLKTKEEVTRAYLQLMTLDDKHQSYLLVVDFKGEIKPLFDSIAEIAKPHLNKFNLNIAPANSKFGKPVIANAEPFYVKK